MKFREWRRWFKNLRGDLKWFAAIILIRSVIDGFWYIKLGFISPLELLGAFIYIFIFLSLFYPKRKIIINSSPDILIKVFTLFLLANLLVLLLFQFSLTNLATSLKFILPFFLYLYLRGILLSERDFEGILQTSLMAATIPFIIFIYENISGSINPQFYKDEIWFRGVYSDIFYYSITCFLSLLITKYFYIKNSRKSNNPYSKLFLLVMATSILLLNRIHHNLSNIVFGVLFIIASVDLYKFDKNKLVRFGILVGTFFLVFVGNEVIQTGFYTTFQTEIDIFMGKVDIQRGLHGRISRWVNYFDIWNSLDIFYHFFGVPLSNIERAGVMISGGMHSDYVRILFATGFIGLFIYILFLYKTYFYKVKGSFAVNKLLRDLIIVIVLFSFTSMPLNYQPLMYIFLTTLVYAQQRNFR